jgi:vacuolar protein sorting-associated protein 13A/C
MSQDIDSTDGIIHKLLKLDGLAVYWNTNDGKSLGGMGDTQASIRAFMKLIAKSGESPKQDLQYILKPVSGTGRLVLRKNYEPGSPKYDAEMEFESLGFELDDEQYTTGVSLASSFESYIRSSKVFFVGLSLYSTRNSGRQGQSHQRLIRKHGFCLQ